MNGDYQYVIYKKIPPIASIELKTHVLGGNDALLFSQKLSEIIVEKVSCVIADLKNVEVMNSSGLGMLVSALSTLRKYNIPLVLASVPEKVMKLLTMTHLDKVFRMYDSLETAIENCG